MTRAGLLACLAVLGCAHGAAGATAAAPVPPVPLYGDLGSHHRGITTRSPEAQRYFDQGLNLVFAFNHEEAIRSFARATVLDPECAMCFWGLAYANGPHINNPTLDADHAAAAWAAIQKAQALAASGNATDAERGFIAALAQRYAADPKAERKPLDEAYAAAMRALVQTYPGDTDAATLFAESLMDLRPWDLWTHDGQPQPGTLEILATLEQVLAVDPNQPGANHFYIHAVEGSPHPEKGLAAAGRLATLVPGAGHLVHMPAHIYMRLGRYQDAAEANRRAIQVDRAYEARSGPQHSYKGYIAHNFHFLWAADLWLGRSAEAAEAEAGIFQTLGPDAVKKMPATMDAVLPCTDIRLVRFGRWDEILALAAPPTGLPLTGAMAHFARGSAFVAKGELAEAAKELAALEKAVPKLSADKGLFMNAPRSVAEIALDTLAGELAAGRGQIDQAVDKLDAATVAEDALNYDEPADWLLPARHVLGRILLAAGRAREAEATYRQDLQRNPENGWALLGLAQALEAQGTSDAAREAGAVRARFEKAWSAADVKLTDKPTGSTF
jgi:tetratricopeptide (TPR) repeat protein